MTIEHALYISLLCKNARSIHIPKRQANISNLYFLSTTYALCKNFYFF